MTVLYVTFLIAAGFVMGWLRAMTAYQQAMTRHLQRVCEMLDRDGPEWPDYFEMRESFDQLDDEMDALRPWSA